MEPNVAVRRLLSTYASYPAPAAPAWFDGEEPTDEGEVLLRRGIAMLDDEPLWFPECAEEGYASVELPPRRKMCIVSVAEDTQRRVETRLKLIE